MLKDYTPACGEVSGNRGRSTLDARSFPEPGLAGAAQDTKLTQGLYFAVAQSAGFVVDPGVPVIEMKVASACSAEFSAGLYRVDPQTAFDLSAAGTLALTDAL